MYIIAILRGLVSDPPSLATDVEVATVTPVVAEFIVNTSAGYPPEPPYPILVEPPPGKYFLLSKVVV